VVTVTMLSSDAANMKHKWS